MMETVANDQHLRAETVNNEGMDVNAVEERKIQMAATRFAKPLARYYFTSKQRDKLEAIFKHNVYPSDEQIVKIAGNLGVCTKRVKVWFTNKRSKMYRPEKSDTRSKLRFTAAQKHIMASVFKENKYPNRYTVENLMAEINSSSKRIKIWFNNQRVKKKCTHSKPQIHRPQSEEVCIIKTHDENVARCNTPLYKHVIVSGNVQSDPDIELKTAMPPLVRVEDIHEQSFWNTMEIQSRNVTQDEKRTLSVLENDDEPLDFSLPKATSFAHTSSSKQFTYQPESHSLLDDEFLYEKQYNRYWSASNRMDRNIPTNFESHIAQKWPVRPICYPSTHCYLPQPQCINTQCVCGNPTPNPYDVGYRHRSLRRGLWPL